MADIVNLRLARKAKTRAEKDRTAAENRAAFGRPKDATALSEASAELARRKLEAHRLEHDGEER
jgi:hypothetical protein